MTWLYATVLTIKLVCRVAMLEQRGWVTYEHRRMRPDVMMIGPDLKPVIFLDENVFVFPWRKP